jgi:hypothetical protein
VSGPWNLDEKGTISNLLAEDGVSWRITRSVGSLVRRRETCPVCNQLMVTNQATTIYYDLNPVARARTVSFHADCTTIFERERAVIRARCDLPGS